ncbi:hypothetical protein VPH35_087539 [Triticum aestivum]
MSTGSASTCVPARSWVARSMSWLSHRAKTSLPASFTLGRCHRLSAQLQDRDTPPCDDSSSTRRPPTLVTLFLLQHSIAGDLFLGIWKRKTMKRGGYLSICLVFWLYFIASFIVFCTGLVV